MHPILAAYGDLLPWFWYFPRFLFFALLFTLAGVALGWLIWGRKGDSAERIEEENDRLLREYHTLQEEFENIDS